MPPGGGVAQVLEAIASADCNRMSRELPCSAHGPGLVRLCTRHCGGNEHREKKMHACAIRTCFRLVDASVDSLVFGVGARLIQRPIRERSLQLLFVHSVPERGALRDDRCRNSLRSPLLTGRIHIEYASLLASFSPDFKRTFYSAFVKLDVLFYPEAGLFESI